MLSDTPNRQPKTGEAVKVLKYHRLCRGYLLLVPTRHARTSYRTLPTGVAAQPIPSGS